MTQVLLVGRYTVLKLTMEVGGTNHVMNQTSMANIIMVDIKRRLLTESIGLIGTDIIIL